MQVMIVEMMTRPWLLPSSHWPPQSLQLVGKTKAKKSF